MRGNKAHLDQSLPELHLDMVEGILCNAPLMPPEGQDQVTVLAAFPGWADICKGWRSQLEVSQRTEPEQSVGLSSGALLRCGDYEPGCAGMW